MAQAKSPLSQSDTQILDLDIDIELSTLSYFGIVNLLLDLGHRDLSRELLLEKHTVTARLGAIVEMIDIAKKADDRPRWFPRGKWTVIQHIEQQVIDFKSKNETID